MHDRISGIFGIPPCLPVKFVFDITEGCVKIFLAHHPVVLFALSFLSQIDAMPDLQHYNGQVVVQQQILVIIEALAHIAYELVMDHFAPLYIRTPYHTSALSGAGWVHELLTGHPKRIRNELGVHKSTFIALIKVLQAPGIGLQSSRHVSIEEQLAIFLYTVVTGISCIHVGERFQRSSDTIIK